MTDITNDVLRLTVPFDLSQGQDTDFYRRVEEFVNKGVQHLLFDCSALSFVHSSHVGLLWKAKEICHQKSITVVLENSSDCLMRTLQALDLVEVFDFSDPSDPRTTLPATRPLPTQTYKPYSGHFEIDVAGVNHGLCEFLEVLDQWQLTEENKFDMRTLFYETATNIRCHSGLPPDSLVKYRASCTDGMLQLVFEDEGTPFNPLSLTDEYMPESAARNRQTRGFGLSLIRRLADYIEYTRKDNTTNVLSLTKRYGDK